MVFKLFGDTEAIYIHKRKGNTEDPYISITENIEVHQNTIFLKEIPEKYNKVKAYNGDTLLTEVEKRNDIKNTNQYFVDYKLGSLYSHSDMNNVTLRLEYKGTGVVLYPASRIYVGENTPEESLKNYLDRVKEHLLLIDGFDESTADVLRKIESIDNALESSDIDRLLENGDYAKSQGDYAKTETNRIKTEFGAIASNLSQLTNNATKATGDAVEATNNTIKATNDINNTIKNLVNKGDYSPTETYFPLNIVSYSGSSYMNVSSCTNIIPTDSSKWKVLSLKGAQGIQGLKGDKGDKGDTGAKGADGFGTKAQYDDIIARLTALEAPSA